MSNQQILYAIFAMSAVMIILKVVPILFFKNKIKNRFIQSFLAYIPYAVLTSMTFPEVFRSTSNIMSASIGVLAALILAYFGQGLLVVALSSTVAAFIAEQVMRLIK